MKPAQHTFTESQIAWLKENYATCTKQEAIDTLGKKWNTIKNRAYHLGLRREAYKQRADEKGEFLRKLIAEGKNARECGQIMGMSKSEIDGIAYHRGLKFGRDDKPRDKPTEVQLKAEYHDLPVDRFLWLVQNQHAWSRRNAQ